jgi:hypothetical protein
VRREERRGRRGEGGEEEGEKDEKGDSLMKSVLEEGGLCYRVEERLLFAA